MALLCFSRIKLRNFAFIAEVALLTLLIINMSQFIDYQNWYAVQLTTLIS